jgi:hypothetical protein
MRFKTDIGESNTSLFKEVKLNRGRHLPLASFTESSDFSVCSYPYWGTGLF